MTKVKPKPARTSSVEDKFRLWREKPVAFVEEVFGVKPDAWQREVLEVFPHHPQLAMIACKGPGKSAVLSWLGWNFLSTRPHPMIGATSISGANLKSGLWTELARWYTQPNLAEGSPLKGILQALFEMTKSEIFCKQHPKTWKLEARTWAADADPAQIGNALAGVHAAYVMWLADEVGDYPPAIMPTLQAIFAGDPKEAHIAMAGNPTRTEGPLYLAATKDRPNWYVINITADPDDPKRTPRVSVEHARKQIATYGRENPWVLVNIFGQFPPQSLNALIGPEAIEQAMRRYYREDEFRHAPKILGVDVARFGDDASIIFPRQGIQAFPPQMLRGVNSVQGASAVAHKWTTWDADACFIDNSGGFGSGWIDNLQRLGRAPIPVDYSGEPIDARYFNKRAEMYFLACEWIKGGGALPDCPELAAALAVTTYTFKGERLLLEPKDEIKVKLGYSPDHADAFVQTFHSPVLARQVLPIAGQRPRMLADYDPFRGM